MALASSEEPMAQRPGADWRREMVAEGASRAKENLQKLQMAPASSEEPLAHCVGAVLRPKMAATNASRAKENLRLDMYFHLRSGFQAFMQNYHRG